MSNKWQLIRKHSDDTNTVFMAEGTYNEMRTALKAEHNRMVVQAAQAYIPGENVTLREDSTFKGVTLWHNGKMVYSISNWIERQI